MATDAWALESAPSGLQSATSSPLSEPRRTLPASPTPLRGTGELDRPTSRFMRSEEHPHHAGTVDQAHRESSVNGRPDSRLRRAIYRCACSLLNSLLLLTELPTWRRSSEESLGQVSSSLASKKARRRTALPWGFLPLRRFQTWVATNTEITSLGCATPSGFLNLLTSLSTHVLSALFRAESALGVGALRGFPLPVAATAFAAHCPSSRIRYPGEINSGK